MVYVFWIMSVLFTMVLLSNLQWSWTVDSKAGIMGNGIKFGEVVIERNRFSGEYRAFTIIDDQKEYVEVDFARELMRK